MGTPAAIAEESRKLLDRLPTLEADELEELVRYHNAAYWDRNDPEVDDPTFDKLVEALRVANPTSRTADVPAKLPKAVLPKGAAKLEVRGEVYMTLSRFKEKYAKEFVNPRNLAAGALKQKDPKKSAEYGLSFFAYDLLGAGCSTEREKW